MLGSGSKKEKARCKSGLSLSFAVITRRRMGAV